MSPALLLVGVVTYFAGLLVLARCVSHGSGAAGFYVECRESPRVVVAFGMTGTSLSGVTFISVPGEVATNGFTYLQIALGQAAGYIGIAFVLLPASAFVVLSRTLGATARLYLVVQVLHTLIPQPLGVPFGLELLVLNGLLTWAGLLLAARRTS
jgi:Na+/proline symporter